MYRRKTLVVYAVYGLQLISITILLNAVRPHRMHAMHRCGLLLKILHVIRSVIYVSVCWA